MEPKPQPDIAATTADYIRWAIMDVTSLLEPLTYEGTRAFHRAQITDPTEEGYFTKVYEMYEGPFVSRVRHKGATLSYKGVRNYYRKLRTLLLTISQDPESQELLTVQTVYQAMVTNKSKAGDIVSMLHWAANALDMTILTEIATAPSITGFMSGGVKQGLQPKAPGKKAPYCPPYVLQHIERTAGDNKATPQARLRACLIRDIALGIRAGNRLNCVRLQIEPHRSSMLDPDPATPQAGPKTQLDMGHVMIEMTRVKNTRTAEVERRYVPLLSAFGRDLTQVYENMDEMMRDSAARNNDIPIAFPAMTAEARKRLRRFFATPEDQRNWNDLEHFISGPMEYNQEISTSDVQLLIRAFATRAKLTASPSTPDMEYPIDALTGHSLRGTLTTLLGNLRMTDSEISRVLDWEQKGQARMVTGYNRQQMGFELKLRTRALMALGKTDWHSTGPNQMPCEPPALPTVQEWVDQHLATLFTPPQTRIMVNGLPATSPVSQPPTSPRTTQDQPPTPTPTPTNMMERQQRKAGALSLMQNLLAQGKAQMKTPMRQDLTSAFRPQPIGVQENAVGKVPKRWPPHGHKDHRCSALCEQDRKLGVAVELQLELQKQQRLATAEATHRANADATHPPATQPVPASPPSEDSDDPTTSMTQRLEEVEETIDQVEQELKEMDKQMTVPPPLPRKLTAHESALAIREVARQPVRSGIGIDVFLDGDTDSEESAPQQDTVGAGADLTDSDMPALRSDSTPSVGSTPASSDSEDSWEEHKAQIHKDGLTPQLFYKAMMRMAKTDKDFFDYMMRKGTIEELEATGGICPESPVTPDELRRRLAQASPGTPSLLDRLATPSPAAPPAQKRMKRGAPSPKQPLKEKKAKKTGPGQASVRTQ